MSSSVFAIKEVLPPKSAPLNEVQTKMDSLSD